MPAGELWNLAGEPAASAGFAADAGRIIQIML